VFSLAYASLHAAMVTKKTTSHERWRGERVLVLTPLGNLLMESLALRATQQGGG